MYKCSIYVVSNGTSASNIKKSLFGRVIFVETTSGYRMDYLKNTFNKLFIGFDNILTELST